MKHTIICLYILVALTVACKKSNSSTELMHSHPAIASIAGKWSVIKDSSFSAIGASPGNVQEYIGQPDDYWDFRTDARVYIKEGAKLDTLEYKLLSDSTIDIHAFGWILNGATPTSTIQPLTFTNAVIYSARDIFLPGGVYFRTLFLKR